MLILDTDSLSILQRESGEAFEILSRRLDSVANEEMIFVTIVSFEEQLRGWMVKVAQAKTEEDQWQAYQWLRGFYDDFKARLLLNYSKEAIRRFHDLRKAKVRIGTMDLKIASIALSYQAKLISRNLRDFQKVPGLIVEDWTRNP
jgi:tRNA(fMet)-specific endonuclease VapC